MSLSPKEIEDGEDGMSEDKDNGSRDEIVIPPKKSRKVATPPEKKVEGKKSPAPMFAEKLVSPSRKRATWAKSAKDKCATLEDRESGRESYEEEEDQNDQDARTLLIKNLPDKVTQHALKEVFEDAFQVRLVSKAGMSKRIADIEFKSQADAERALEEKQGMEIHGLAIVLDHTAEKRRGQENGDREQPLERKTEDGTGKPRVSRKMGESLFLCGDKEYSYMFMAQLWVTSPTSTPQEPQLGELERSCHLWLPALSETGLGGTSLRNDPRAGLPSHAPGPEDDPGSVFLSGQVTSSSTVDSCEAAVPEDKACTSDQPQRKDGLEKPQHLPEKP
ncbi:uncharacterized protein PS065_020794 [Dugong dugon]